MKTIKRVILCFVCTFMIHSTLFTFNVLKAKESVKHDSYTAMMKSDEVDLYSQNAILINLNDDRILYEKQIKEKIYPASMTKIMTTLVAIEKIDDLDARVSITQDMLAGLREANASVAGFRVGESVSYRDLLYGILLPSGADASRAIAFSIFQDEEHFVQAMNEKAKAIKMKDTHFVNVSGLHDDEHYSSVYDISILLREALQNELFKTIFCTPSYQCENGLTLYSTLQRQAYNAHLDVSFIAGAKTGFTNEASLCLASYTKMNDEEYIMVSAQTNSDSSYPYHIVDAITLYQYVFTHYTRVSVVHKDELIKKVILTHSAKDEYPLKAKQDINVLVKDGNVDHIKIVYDGKTHVEAPLFVDDKIATLNVYDGKDVIYKEDIYLQENIEKDSIAYYFHHLDRFVMDFKYVIITCVALIFVSLTYLKYKKQK